jgi:hypothetical protein
MSFIHCREEGLKFYDVKRARAASPFTSFNPLSITLNRIFRHQRKTLMTNINEFRMTKATVHIVVLVGAGKMRFS